jgi:hypothetical protein
MHHRLLGTEANALHVAQLTDLLATEVRTVPVLRPDSEDQPALRKDLLDLGSDLRIVECLVGLFEALEHVWRLDDVDLANDRAHPADGAGKRLHASHLNAARQRTLVPAPEPELHLQAAAALFLGLGFEPLELLGPWTPFWSDGPDLHEELRVFRDGRADDS